MRPIQLIACLSFVSTLIHAYIVAKNTNNPLPMQFDGSGNPTWFASPETFVMWQFILLSFINTLTLGLSFFLNHFSMRWINIPWKRHWLSTPQLQEKCKIILESTLALTAIYINLIAFLAQEMIWQKATNEKMVFSFTISLNFFLFFTLSTTILFLISIFYAFKPKQYE